MNDETRKNDTYRHILASAHKLESIQSNLESVIDFFSAPIVKTYTKLSNDCMKLLFECDFKLDYYRKAEELLWRRIYYDIYRFHKTKKAKIVERQDELLVESHFVSGIGFYSTFIIKLRSHYGIHETRGLVPPFNLSLGPVDNFVADKRLNDDVVSRSLFATDVSQENSNYGSDKDSARNWARLAIYRSLVYIGDLARYLLEINQPDYRKLAYDFYLSASRNQPDYGLPFNQLATLAGGQNCNLDAVCNYMRCCLRQKPFERAEGNMQSLFEFNVRLLGELSRSRRPVLSVSDVFASKDPSLAAESMIQSVIVNFIKLTSDLWSAIVVNHLDVQQMNSIADETRAFFEALKEALELDPIVPLSQQQTSARDFEPISDGAHANERPRYITPSIMYELCSISIMLIAKFQRRKLSKVVASNELDDLVHALALNLLYYSTSRCQKMIILKLQELRISQADQADLDASRGANNQSNTWRKQSYDGLNSTASGRKSLSRLRQKEAASNYLDKSKATNATTTQTDDSDMSELEETALSTIDALEISSDMSEEADRQVSDLIDLASSSGDDESVGFRTHSLFGNSLRNLNSGGLSRSVLRPTRSQNYTEIHSRSNHLYGSTSSLPVQDLVTGESVEQLSQKAFNSSRASTFLDRSGNNLGSKDRFSPADSSDDLETSNQLVREIDRVYAFVYKQTYLPTIKVFCDWLLSNGHIIGANLSSFHAFQKELENLEVLLDDLKRVAESRDSGCAPGATTNINHMDTSDGTITSDDEELHNLLENHCFKGPTWKQRYPLSCDYPLYDLEPVQTTHEMNIDFNSQRELTDCESGFISIQCAKAFSHALGIFLDNKHFD